MKICHLILAALPLFAQQPHELINATLWTQTAVEHHAITIQSFQQARMMLDRALKDKKWTAALEQTGNSRKLPPAVIVDVDETVLDNSSYEVRRILANDDFESKSWTEWAMEAQAPPLPGAFEFGKYAVSRGVAIYYVTNREARVKEATIRNLQTAGFPANGDTVMCLGEKPEWTSDKSSRRKEVASHHRILLLVGDDFGDFMSGARQAPAQRQAAAEPYRENWGVKWIVLPNPMYGSWEGTHFSFEAVPREQRLRRKWNALDPKSSPK